MKRTVLLLCLLALAAAASEVPLQEAWPGAPYADPLWAEMEAKGAAAMRGAEAYQLPAADYDQRHLDLDLALTYNGPNDGYLEGTATWTIESTTNGLDEIVMELDELTVNSVGGDADSFNHAGNTLTIYLDGSFDDGEQFSVEIDYEGEPTAGMYFDSDNGGLIHTFTEPYDSSHWFPCYDSPDDRFTCDQHYTVRDDWLVSSNGDDLPTEVDNGDGTKTFSWSLSYEMPTYLVAMAASDYAFFTDYFKLGSGEQPVHNWVYQDHLAEAEEDLGITPEMVEFCSTIFTDYKYPRYGHMITEIGGAMEHTTTTSMSSGAISGYHHWDSVVVHELGHQWFGDWITCETWPDIWLNEGFASYTEGLWAEHIDGEVGLRSTMQQFRNWYFNEDSFWRYPVYDPDRLFGTTVYKKGAWVLHMLRRRGDDATFFAMLQDYVDAYPKGTVLTSEFIDIAEDYYGGDGSLDQFFWQWLYMAGYPEYEMTVWNEETTNGHLCHIELEQVQSTDDDTPEVFVTPVELLLGTSSGYTDVVFDNDQRQDSQSFSVDGPVTNVIFDPECWLLYKLQYSDAPVVTLGSRAAEDGVLVEWRAEGEVAGVELFRDDGLASTKLNENPLSGEGAFLDRPNAPGVYRYRLVVTGTDGERASFETGELQWREAVAPLALSAPWPNPTSDVISVEFNLPSAGEVELAAYDLAGRRVGTLTSGELTAGRHQIDWSAAELPDGVYLLRLETAAGSRTSRVVKSSR